jgi:hypothetical protein
MKKIITMALVSVCCFLLSNCDLEEEQNFYFVNLEITAADVPDFFVLNQEHNLEVTFARPDGCTYFQGFDASSDVNGVTTIVAIGSVITTEDCISSEESLTAELSITAERLEFYTLRFYAGEDAEGNPQYLEYSVPVVDGINQ